MIILLLCLASLMYLEGMTFSVAVVSFSSLRNRWLKLLAMILWPIAVPYLAYKMYVMYSGVIKVLQNNPFLSSFLLPTTDASPQELNSDTSEISETKENQGN